MIREILFRGKLCHSDTWVYGNLCKTENESAFILPTHLCGMDRHHFRIESDEPFSVEPDTIGQFTGMVDKDGLKIFENDVVRFENYCCVEKVTNIATGIVEFSDAEFCVKQISGIDRGWMNLFYGPDGKEFSWNELEIIGNIFDNPELAVKNA